MHIIKLILSFCRRLYYSTEDPCPILVFQDLKTIGFKMADREAGLDETHCRVALTKLARMHAASYVMAERVYMRVMPYKINQLNK